MSAGLLLELRPLAITIDALIPNSYELHKDKKRKEYFALCIHLEIHIVGQSENGDFAKKI